MLSALALIISIVALLLAYSAYNKSGGSTDDLKSKVEALGISTENLRKKTADALNRFEKTVRGENKNSGQSTENTEEKTQEGEIVPQDFDRKEDQPNVKNI